MGFIGVGKGLLRVPKAHEPHIGFGEALWLPSGLYRVSGRVAQRKGGWSRSIAWVVGFRGLGIIKRFRGSGGLRFRVAKLIEGMGSLDDNSLFPPALSIKP